jgi:hypothetical protein
VLRNPVDRVVERSSISGPCIVFDGAKIEGYGVMSVANKVVRVHRLMWEQLVGPIPDGMTLDHLCRNHACWWSDHLEVVPRGENALRGFGPTAQNRRKTVCNSGHALTGENVYEYRGERRCRRCAQDRKREWKERQAIA